MIYIYNGDTIWDMYIYVNMYIYIYTCIYICICVCIYIYISADPYLRQGRGGAWDHRRCETCFCRLTTLKNLLGTPNPAGNRHPKARSIASHGRSSLPFASLSTLKILQNPPGTPNPAGTSYPKATSMAPYGRSSLPFARP